QFGLGPRRPDPRGPELDRPQRLGRPVVPRLPRVRCDQAERHEPERRARAPTDERPEERPRRGHGSPPAGPDGGARSLVLIVPSGANRNTCFAPGSATRSAPDGSNASPPGRTNGFPRTRVRTSPEPQTDQTVAA